MDEIVLNRITADPEIFGGKPIIRGMRISVELLSSLLAQGERGEAILDDYPELEPEDIRACLAYAHAVIANDRIARVKCFADRCAGRRLANCAAAGRAVFENDPASNNRVNLQHLVAVMVDDFDGDAPGLGFLEWPANG
jgi:uncharacterized protein (DUF433 family)